MTIMSSFMFMNLIYGFQTNIALPCDEITNGIVLIQIIFARCYLFICVYFILYSLTIVINVHYYIYSTIQITASQFIVNVSYETFMWRI